jgi:predicted solute-binding protein
VSYLNTVPLAHGLAPTECDLSFAVPSECARRVESGAADLGIVPVAEMHRLGWEHVPGTGIACAGPVRSILLASRADPRRIRTLATDTGSRTSVQLARIVLRNRYDVDPEIVPMAPDLGSMLAQADAALLIGDAALRVDPASLPHHVLDLGEEWWRLARLPMVFALWAGPGERIRRWGRARLETMFRRSLDSGLADMDRIVAAESARRGFPPGLVRDYLTRNIKFRIGAEEERGLAAFLQQVADLEVQTVC